LYSRALVPSLLRDIGASVSFLTILPGGRSPMTLRGAIWFWVAGLLVATLDVSLFVVFFHVLTKMETAVIVVLADGVVTRGMHYDAVADFSDGFFAPLDRNKRLKAMGDSRLGAFGAMGLIAVVLLRVAAFASFSTSEMYLFIPLAVASRDLMAIALYFYPSAKKEGFFYYFLSGDDLSRRSKAVRRFVVIGIFLLSGVAAFEMEGIWSIVAVVLEASVFFAVMQWSIRSIDGVTGDVVGGGGILAESVALVAISLVGLR